MRHISDTIVCSADLVIFEVSLIPKYIGGFAICTYEMPDQRLIIHCSSGPRALTEWSGVKAGTEIVGTSVIAVGKRCREVS